MSIRESVAALTDLLEVSWGDAENGVPLNTADAREIGVHHHSGDADTGRGEDWGRVGEGERGVESLDEQSVGCGSSRRQIGFRV